jgi:RNA polymerase sigma-70 factor (ECF subfamily)
MDQQYLDIGRTFVAHHGQLRGVAQKIVGTRELADDVAQEAYLKLIEAAAAFSARHPLAYCFQVVRNLAIDYRRRMALESNLFTEEEEGLHMPTPRATPEQSAIHRQSLALVDKALDQLPARTRQVFELHRLGGLTQRDIGKRLGVSAALVNAMIREASNALMQLRHALVWD